MELHQNNLMNSTIDNSESVRYVNKLITRLSTLTTTTLTEKSVDSCVTIATEVLDTLKILQNYLKTHPNISLKQEVTSPATVEAVVSEEDIRQAREHYVHLKRKWMLNKLQQCSGNFECQYNDLTHACRKCGYHG